MSLTVNFPAENFNSFDATIKNQVKRKLNTSDLYIVGNKLNDKGLVELLPYKENRNSKNIYSSISQIGVLGDGINIKDGIWNGKSYILKEFKKMGSTALIHSTQAKNALTVQKHIEQVKSVLDSIDKAPIKIAAYENMKVMKKMIWHSQETYFNSPTRKFPPLKKSL